jgi:hypothetical protein
VTVERFRLKAFVVLIPLLCGSLGCGGSDRPKEMTVAPAHDQLRNLTTAYAQATNALNRPPANAEEVKPYFAKLGGEDAPRPTIDWADWQVHWGADLRNLPPGPDGVGPIWVYAKNPVGGKRWVVQGRFPVELTEDQFRAAAFAPGLKKPF